MASNTLETFFKDVGKTPLLTREEEVSLSKRIEAGDQAARRHMVKANIRLAISIAKKYQNKGCDLEDLIQESNIGLLKAVDRYDWRRGFKFSTYACWWIKQAVRRHITAHSSSIKLPSYARSILWKAKKASEEYHEEFGMYPTREEVAELLGVSVSMLKNLVECSSITISIDSPTSYSGANGSSNGRSFGEMLPDPAEDVDTKLDREKIINIVRESLSTLSEREEKIIRLRFGVSEDPTDHCNYPITAKELQKIKEDSIIKEGGYEYA